MSEAEACRVDVWLWRARFVRTRSEAAALVERGSVRLTRHGRQSRADKPGRAVHVGDRLLIARDGRLTEVRIEALGARRGPPAEARALYADLEAGAS